MNHRLALIVAFVGLGGTLQASILSPPFAGLQPGDTYHLAFVTRGVITGESDDISSYDGFVSQEAAAVESITEHFDVEWFAIASTSAVSARYHALVSAPVYLLDGTLLSSGFDDIWSAAGLTAPLNLDQFCAERNASYVWTGSYYNGNTNTGNALGNSQPITGESTNGSAVWIQGLGRPRSNTYPLYALSEPLTVPVDNQAIPEPTTFVVWSLLGLTAGCVYWWRR